MASQDRCLATESQGLHKMQDWLTESLLSLDSCDFHEAPAFVSATGHADRGSEGKALAEPCLPEIGICPVHPSSSVASTDSTPSSAQTPAPYPPSPFLYRHTPTPGSVVPCCSPIPPSTPASLFYPPESPFPATCDLTNDGLTSGAEEEAWPEDRFVWSIVEDHQPVFGSATKGVTSLSISATLSSPSTSTSSALDPPTDRHAELSSACPQPWSVFEPEGLSSVAGFCGDGGVSGGVAGEDNVPGSLKPVSQVPGNLTDTTQLPADGCQTMEMETLDPQMARAYQMSRTTGSLMPLIKEELKYTIMSRRHSAGQSEIVVDFPPPENPQLSEEDKMRRHQRLETNRAAAARHRQKKKESRRQEEEEVLALEGRNQQLRAEVNRLEGEIATFRALLALAPTPE